MFALMNNVINDVKLYIPSDTALIIAEKYNEISNKQTTECKINALLWCKPTLIEAYLDIQCGD